MKRRRATFRDLYGMSGRWVFLFYLFQCFAWSMLVLNSAMLIWNLYSRSYGSAVISGTVTVMLVIVMVRLHRQTARHRREYDEHLAQARRFLQQAFAVGMCPDCAELSLDDNLTCQRVECGSRFYCDPVTNQWTRLQ